VGQILGGFRQHLKLLGGRAGCNVPVAGSSGVFSLSVQISYAFYKYSVQGKTMVFLSFVYIRAGGDGSSLPPWN